MQEKKPKRPVWALPLAWGCFLVFLVPVFFASLVSPYFFSSGGNPSDASFFSKIFKNNSSQKPSSNKTSKKTISKVDTKLGLEDKEPTYITVPNDPLLDPVSEGTFLVSFSVLFKESPKDRYRIKLITKYDSAAAPYPGWAIALRSQSGALRPEVYWRGEDENGGWYSFGELILKLNSWNQFILVVENGEVLSLFIKEDTGVSSNEAFFMGGYSTEENLIPSSNGELKLKAPLPGAEVAKVAIKDVIVASKPNLILNIDSAISGGISEITKVFEPESIHLYIDSQGQDLSRVSRKLDFSSSS